MHKQIFRGTIIFFSIIIQVVAGTGATLDIIPKLKEKWLTDSTIVFKWEPGISENVNIVLCGLPGNIQVHVIANNLDTKTLPVLNTFSWEIPKVVGSSYKFYIKIMKTDGSEISQSRRFYIEARKIPKERMKKSNFSRDRNLKKTIPRIIRITSPARGEVWVNNRPYVIKWATNLTEALRIHLCRADDKVPISTILHNTNRALETQKNQYVWRVPNHIAPGIFMIRIGPTASIEWSYSKRFRIMRMPAGNRKNFR